MTEPDTTDSAVLAGSAYADERNLQSRQSLYSWQHPTYDLPALVMERLPTSAETILDMGCGNGTYLTRIRREMPWLNTIGLDVSAGILPGTTSSVIVGDAGTLPFRTGSVDVVLAMHMLYHVADPQQALAEAVRVTGQGGTLVASTNARDDKKELNELWSTAASDVLRTRHGPRRISLSERFALDEAPEILARFYGDVDVIELPGTITVHTPEPVIAHLSSYRTWAAQSGVPFEATLSRAAEIVQQTINRDGAFHITCHGGVVLCHAPK